MRVLCDAGADFVIIRGLAVMLHGGLHVTDDVDLAFVRSRQNLGAIVKALSPYHPRPYQFPVDLPFVWDEQSLRSSTVLTLTTDLGRLDLLAEPDGASKYSDLKARAVPMEVFGYHVLVASIDDMIAMKEAAGRPKDLMHAAELRSLKALLEEGS